MKRTGVQKRCTDERIVGLLTPASSGAPVNAVCGEHRVSDVLFHLWRCLGGMDRQSDSSTGEFVYSSVVSGHHHPIGVAMYLTGLLLAIATRTPTASALDPARLMLLDASSCQFVIMQKSLSEYTAEENAKFESDRAKARSDMQNELPEAIRSAGESFDLKASIQAFYTAATAYCDDPSSSNKHEYNAQHKVLDKKLEDAGR